MRFLQQTFLSLVICLAAAGSALAADARPVYLDIIPTAGAQNVVLPEDVVAAMARETLASKHEAVIRMNGKQTLPVGVRVLRIMYIIHEQPEIDGTTLAAAASTELLRTAADASGTVQTFSIYNGIQQTLVQAPNSDRAQVRLREAFKRELQSRIASAFTHTAAQ